MKFKKQFSTLAACLGLACSLGSGTAFATAYTFRVPSPGMTGASSADPAPTDPYWANVSQLVRFDGNFVDAKGSTVTATAGVAFTSNGKFGSAADLSNSNGDAITFSGIPSGSLFSTGATFTVEYWANLKGTTSKNFGFGEQVPGGGQQAWVMGFDWTGKPSIYWWDGAAHTINGTAVVPFNTWVHMAFSVNAGAVKIFVNGSQVGSGTISTPNQLLPVRLGSFNTGKFNGSVDDLRVTPGVARYNTNFTIPSTEYPSQ